MNRREMIRKDLVGIYGEEKGVSNYDYLMRALEEFRRQNKTGAVGKNGADSQPSEKLAGKVFAICYPDNVYNDTDPTLETLEAILREHFPAINGIHILPERLMSHDDLWPQDLLSLLPAHLAVDLVERLVAADILAKDRTAAITRNNAGIRSVLIDWYDAHTAAIECEREIFVEAVCELIESRRTSHFNDGGFSQVSRARVDPRFGDVEKLRSLSNSYALMLDYVANHLDIDNETLEAYRRGENDGSAFIIISPGEYERRKQNGDIAKAFRPRPFPLFTGLRRYPRPGATTGMDAVFEQAGLQVPDQRVTRFLSIYFKVRNDQGLTKEDRKILDDFIDYLLDNGMDAGLLFTDSAVQEGQPALTAAAGSGIGEFCELAGLTAAHGDAFELHDDEILGEKFFVYTTFSESQADINPVSGAGFRLIIDDLLHLLESGDLAMLRMDAIKYLWKEIGKRNFDMKEGDKLIEVIRQVLALARPGLIPLDEVNSFDGDVYRMGNNGGFAYLFGQVNAVPLAFNSGSLGPLERLTSMMAERCPDDLLLFVMLSTHDGRSVQGIGVDRRDGHASIGAFSELLRVVETRGGKVKYRSVPAGAIPAETFEKACAEMGISPAMMDGVFCRNGDEYTLKDRGLGREKFMSAVLETAGRGACKTGSSAVVHFLAEWVIAGRTAYELCCTSRAAFDPAGGDGGAVTPVEEARRLALAQVFVLSFGQSVPAIYFNDLIGFVNDTAGYARSGKPRDLNRHKSHVDELKRALAEDEFTRAYVPMINRAIEARSADPAFRPGSRGYEFVCPADTVFLNHAFNGSYHSLVVGNISRREAAVHIDLSKLTDLDGGREMTDRLTGETYRCDGAAIDLAVPGYGALWLSL